MNGFSHVLLGADYDGEDDEYDSGVQVVQAVDPIIIVATFQTRIRRKTAQYAVKPGESTCESVSSCWYDEEC